MNDLAERVLYALVVGFITGLVVALLLWVLAVLTPLDTDYGMWGTVVGVIAGIYAFVTRKRIV